MKLLIGKTGNHIGELNDQTTLVDEKIAELKEILLGNEHFIAMGNQCTMPYKCQFTDYYKRNELNNS